MKKIIYFALFALVLLSLSCSSIKDSQWPEQTAKTKPATRWWWLGSAVDSANLAYNIEQLGKAGIGAVEITPIYGVKGNDGKNIEYLSPKWMNMLSWTEKQAHKYNMLVDMNNGTGWPFGGPEVDIDNAAAKAIFQHYYIKSGNRIELEIKVDDPKQKDVARLSRLISYSESGEKVDLTDKVSEDGILILGSISEDCNLIALFIGKTFQKVKRAAPGGEGYVVDHFNKDAMNKYFEKFNSAFNSTNTRFPNSFFNDSYEVYGANWTPSLLEEFQHLRGYKLEDFFPELLAKGESEASVRVITDYRKTIEELLLDNFTTQWTKWANQHGATTRNQAHGSPANIIDIYAGVDIPECEIFGISDFDITGLRKDSLTRSNDGDPVTLKLASSAAHISGKKYTSAETFTWLTEHFRTSLSQCKPEIDQMFVSGVNNVYFHGTPYSPKEEDWPGWLFYASINMSPTNSIWRDAPAFFNYITRVQSFLQYGKPDNDLLLYFPIYDIWNEQKGNFFTTFAIHGLRKRLPKFYNIVEEIKRGGRDVDYISDSFIESATVENGLILTAGGVSYKALIMPSAKSIPVSTANKLISLAEQGAKIIFVDNYPDDVPGFNDFGIRKEELSGIIKKFPQVDFAKTSINSFGKGNVLTGSDLHELFELTEIAPEKFITDYNGQSIRRKHDKGWHYFMTMLSDNSIDGWMPISVKAKSSMLFDPITGNSGKAKVRTNNGTTEVYMQLLPGESIILKTFTNKDINSPNWSYYQSSNQQIELKNNWTLSFVVSEPQINKTIQIDSLYSWTHIDEPNFNTNMGTAKYSTTFAIDNIDANEYLLSLGDVRESARVYINNKEVITLFSVPFQVHIGQYIKTGVNTLDIEVTNLPANRIADYDRRGIEWRKFNEINFVDVNYKNTKYDNWDIIPSGLLGPVVIQALYLKD